MSKNIEISIIKNMKFMDMVRARNRFAMWLSIVILCIYFLFIGIASFYPALLAQTMGDRALTLGIPMAALVIIISWLITGIYIYVTNQHFDRIKEELKQEYEYE